MSRQIGLTERLRAVKVLALDVDGVLTDGRIYVADNGDQIRAFDVKDGTGIVWLLRCGIRVAILSGECREAVRIRAERLGIGTVLLGYKDKYTGFCDLLAAERVKAAEVCYVGDDAPDAPVMRAAGVGVAVADATSMALASADWVTKRPGGRGAVREV
ncbi:MAG TPA: HAD hydrolase family protein, partial [Candidatus Brocadiia bacterium]|nr:HAD hydrolase family protein [Candidatus Brocadiia bacterium]